VIAWHLVLLDFNGKTVTDINRYRVRRRSWPLAGLVALTVFAVGEGFSSVVGNADGETVSATNLAYHVRSDTFVWPELH
jgi:hypothetical protein